MKDMIQKGIIFSIITSSLVFPFSTFAQYRSSYNGGESFNRSSSEWRRESSVLRNKIDDLDNDPVDDLPLPVLFGVPLKSIFPNFGDKRSGGRSHEGEDIMAAEGLPIVSPTEAVVIRIGDGSSSGKYVTTANPGGESFVYMHLSEVADIDEGDVLKAGDIIGYVGHTGNAVASAPHLHLEIHDEDGDATDPYPRLTAEFDLEEKMEFLEDILKDADDEEELAELLVTKARSDFTAATAAGIELPDSIIDALKDVPVAVSVASSVSNSSLLKVGSRGPAVKDLQEFLIDKDVGSSADKVKADGVFGPITRKAVIDYQKSVGLVADGVAGPKTLAYIKVHSN